MHKPRIVIIEDDLIIAETIAEHIVNLGYEVSAKIKSARNAISTLEKTEYDLALVDINIDGNAEGIQLGKYLYSLKKPFIYLTSYADPDTLSKVKETHPDAYIIKPFTQRDLYTNIELVLSRNKLLSKENTKNRIKINDGYKQVFINAEDVMYVKSEGIYLKLQTTQKAFFLRSNFKSLFELFPKEVIKRVHRSWAVNPTFITELSASNLKINDESIPISKSYRNALKVEA